ncbi:MAG TPA: hypothetical protein VKL61_10475 [Candidatus Polarisedimenticolia bacterium]|nr:hypothetical protein [Candidatus Polarisedimenticolia bacterium]
MHRGVRELILRKSEPRKRKAIRTMFEKEPFGAFERLVTQKLLDVVKRVAKEELDDEKWLRTVARLSRRSCRQMRVIVLEFLETDVFNISIDNCVTFLEPLIESWDIDLETFAMEIVFSRRLVPGRPKRLEFVERNPPQRSSNSRGSKLFSRIPPSGVMRVRKRSSFSGS